MPRRPAKNYPLVSVVIPCRNEAKCIEKCLKSILKQERPAGGLEIIVADGVSEDGTRDIVERMIANATSGGKDLIFSDTAPLSMPSIRLICNEGRTVSRGLNAAIRAAIGDIIIRVDAHTEYAADYVRQCVAMLELTQADNVGGPARTRADGYMGAAIAAAYHSPFAVGGAKFHNENYEGWVDTVTYGCWPRQTFERFGYFDEELARNQDDEHNLRIHRGGGRVWQSPQIMSWYHPRGSLTALFQQYMQYGYWKVRVIQKHKLPASIRHVVPGAFVLLVGFCLALWVVGYILRLTIGTPDIIGQAAETVLLSIVGMYLICTAAASLVTASRNGWKLLPVLPLVFATFHLAYGCGFLCGIWAFTGHKSESHARFEVLSR